MFLYVTTLSEFLFNLRTGAPSESFPGRTSTSSLILMGSIKLSVLTDSRLTTRIKSLMHLILLLQQNKLQQHRLTLFLWAYTQKHRVQPHRHLHQPFCHRQLHQTWEKLVPADTSIGLRDLCKYSIRADIDVYIIIDRLSLVIGLGGS